jgi:hypothetical protein
MFSSHTYTTYTTNGSNMFFVKKLKTYQIIGHYFFFLSHCPLFIN